MILYEEQVLAIVDYILHPYEKSVQGFEQILEDAKVSPKDFATHKFSEEANEHYDVNTLQDKLMQHRIKVGAIQLVGHPETLAAIRTELLETLSMLLEPNTALGAENFRLDTQRRKNYEIEEDNATINPFEEAPRQEQPEIHMNIGSARVDKDLNGMIRRVCLHLDYDSNNPVHAIFKDYNITHLENVSFAVNNDGSVEVSDNNQIKKIRQPGEGTPVLQCWMNDERQNR